MVTGGECHVLPEPVRRRERLCRLLIRELHFSQEQALVGIMEDIQFDGQSLGERDLVAGLSDPYPVRLFPQVQIGILCQRQVVLLADHQAL